jgi:hypothetical protein
LRRGRQIDLAFDEDAYVFARQLAGETIIVAFNRAAAPKKIAAPAAFAGLADGAELAPLISTTKRGRIAGGEISFEIPARTAVAYRVLRRVAP